MTDRRIGYIALAVLAAFGAVCLALVGHEMLRPTEKRIAHFTNIGTLKLADPLCIRGVTVARVTRIAWRDDGAYLTLTAPQPLHIHTDYVLAVVDLGVMGDRLLTLDPGSDTAALVPARDTLAGRFVIGPSEALGMVGRLREVVSGFAELSFVLLHGDARHPSLVQQYARIARVADSLSVRLLALSRQLDGGFSRRAHALYHLTGTTARLSADLTEATPQMLAELRARVDAIAKAADDLEALVRKARPLVAKIDSPEARALGERLDHLQQQLTDLRSSLQDVRHRGVNLLLWPF